MSRCSDCDCSKAEECQPKDGLTGHLSGEVSVSWAKSLIPASNEDTLWPEPVGPEAAQHGYYNPNSDKGQYGQPSLYKIDVVNLQPQDVLMVTLKDSSITEADLSSFKEHMKALFPNNQVMVIALSENSEVLFTKITKD